MVVDVTYPSLIYLLKLLRKVQVGVFMACFASFSCGWRASSFPTRREELMIGILDSEEEGEGDEVDELNRL